MSNVQQVAEMYAQICLKRDRRIKVEVDSDEEWFLEMEISLMEYRYYEMTGLTVQQWHDSLVTFNDESNGLVSKNG